MATATDDFNRADSTDLGTAWTPLLNTWRITSNAGRSNTAGETAEYNNTVSPGASQYAQAVTTGTVGASGGCGVAVRMAETDNYYGIYSYATAKDIFKVTGGSWVAMATSGTAWPSGSTVRLEATGTSTTTLTPMLGGTTDTALGVQTDSSSPFTSGSVGVNGWGIVSGSDQSLNSWEGGDLGGSTPDAITWLPRLVVSVGPQFKATPHGMMPPERP